MFRGLILACALVAEARVLTDVDSIHKAIQVDKTLADTHISPTLKPESSKLFFNKDYPGDKKPKVDVLHFKHPYPVVQDSEEFDKDFVKDENTDNGEWKAQQEYDRLRHKLAKLKKQAADALAKKNEEKSELDDAMRKYQAEMEKEKAEIAQKSNEIVKPAKPGQPPIKPEKPVKPNKPAAEKVVKETEQVETAPAAPAKKKDTKEPTSSQWAFPWGWTWKWPKAPKVPVPDMPDMPKLPPDVTHGPGHVDTSDAAKAVERAMDNLKECQRQLAEAKAELKKLMDELEKAKLEQVEAHERVKQAMMKQLEAEKIENRLHEKYNEEAAEHAAAEAAYLKQKAIVDKLRAQLEAAAAKVKAMRDAEDKDGGVYPTPKSAAQSIAASSLFVLGLTLLA